MADFIPLFPLNLVVFPTEQLNLHIFEPRYRQLIKECIEQDRTFGVPAYINQEMQKTGTEVKLVDVENFYEDGRMDIKTLGIRSFQILDFQNPAPDKPYAGGNVAFSETPSDNADPAVTFELLEKLDQLYQVMSIHNPPQFSGKHLLSFQIAHKMGLSIEQEYELLLISDEAKRQQYLLKHLNKAIPILWEAERTKEKIRMNGHFKNMNPLDF
jgi:Lon protease-like protein